MKKSIIIWGVAIILVGVAVYTTTAYSNRAQDLQGPQAADGGPRVTQAASAPAVEEEQSGSQENDKLNVMEKLDFTLEDVDGNKVTLSSLKGKNVFMNFWTTWCPYCVQEMPDIEKLYGELKDQDLVVIAVNSGEDKKTVQDFLDKNKFSFKVLLDTDGKVSQMYQVSSLPTSYFIDAEGNLVGGHVGGMALEDMRKNVEALK